MEMSPSKTGDPYILQIFLGTNLQPVLIWICGRSCYQNMFISVKMFTVPWLAEANQSCVALTEWTTCSEVCRSGISFVTVRFKEFYSGSKAGSNVIIHWVLWVYLATLHFLLETAGIIVSLQWIEIINLIPPLLLLRYSIEKRSTY